jgi:hypothetical protein
MTITYIKVAAVSPTAAIRRLRMTIGTVSVKMKWCQYTIFIEHDSTSKTTRVHSYSHVARWPQSHACARHLRLLISSRSLALPFTWSPVTSIPARFTPVLCVPAVSGRLSFLLSSRHISPTEKSRRCELPCRVVYLLRHSLADNPVFTRFLSSRTHRRATQPHYRPTHHCPHYLTRNPQSSPLHFPRPLHLSHLPYHLHQKLMANHHHPTCRQWSVHKGERTLRYCQPACLLH